MYQPTLIKLNSFSVDRGVFKKVFDKISPWNDFNFSQINISNNKKKGTVRGLHIQKSPFQETKVIKCIKGSLIDFCVDLRVNSSTYKNVIKFSLDESDNNLLYIPKGFAHGFQTLDDNTDLLYFHDQDYYHEAEIGINIGDPELNINIPLKVSVQSKKDKELPYLKDRFHEMQTL